MPLSTHSSCPPRLRAQRSPFAPSSSCKSGFTLIEMMLIVAIVAVLAVIALASHAKYRERVQTMQAVTDIASLQPLIAQYALDNNFYPDSLADIARDTMKDPWGNPYQYLSHDGPAHSPTSGQWRKDHSIVPINSDYDLWSNGSDGQSSPPLTAKHSRDDIVRANNGRFIGPASDFDP
jgi:general secretion pathway protein G